LLDEPALDQLVRQLRGPEWKAVVRHVGLEDSSELLALSTPEQLVELIDETLWTGGTSEAFDLERFATLLEVLHESGTQSLADKVAGLPEEFLTMALSKLVSVWPAEFLRQLAEADESGVLDKKLESHAFEDFDEYTVLSPSGLAWDALVALFSSWGDSQPELMSRLFERLSLANVNGIGEVDELVNVLDEMAEFEEEAQAEREERRVRSGYVSGSDARAFLRLPATTKPGETDAISAAYFRRLGPDDASGTTKGDPRLLEILRRHAPVERTSRERRLGAGSGLLKLALEELARSAPERHARALEELAFLTNVVMTTLIGFQSEDAAPPAAEAFRSVAVSIETAALTEIGLEPAQAASKLATALAEWGPIGLFRQRPL
jgi:hypothetical protein